jgi:hypothetical protein
MDNGRFAVDDYHSGSLKGAMREHRLSRARLVAERIDDVVVYKERVKAFLWGGIWQSTGRYQRINVRSHHEQPHRLCQCFTNGL